MRLGVVYLARRSNHPRFLRYFLASLRRNPSGYPYDLVVILKGYPPGAAIPKLQGFNAPGLGRLIQLPMDDALFATETFFRAAQAVDYDALLFFVSWSRILAPDWGRIVVTGLGQPGAGLVGGSSGFESLDSRTPFPNPSIRTTGFAIAREVWLGLDCGDQSSKFGGNLFEAGPASMTKQILRQGKGAVVAGRDGRYYPSQLWRDSQTFRLGTQSNLLFADNRTRDFDVARPSKRQRLAELNWAPSVPVVPVSRLARVLGKLRWRFDF